MTRLGHDYPRPQSSSLSVRSVCLVAKLLHSKWRTKLSRLASEDKLISAQSDRAAREAMISDSGTD